MVETDDQTSFCYVVSPATLKVWFPDFVELSPLDRIIYTDEAVSRDKFDVFTLLKTCAVPRDATIIFCSSHQSLGRDYEAALLLRSRGYNVAGIEQQALTYGYDKLKMKALFDRHDIPTPSWTSIKQDDTISAILARVRSKSCVLKERSSTSSIGLFSSETFSGRLTEEYYAEAFVDGEEYSVIAVSTPQGIVTFPPVWKGASRKDLLPPYKRLRACPFPLLEEENALKMKMLTEQLALAVISPHGFLEAEFIMTPDKRVLVIEINPRIAGTVLMSAMATETKIFNLIGRNGLYSTKSGSITAKCYTIEIPLIGQPPDISLEGVYFTSRMTVSGSGYIHIYDKLQRVCELGGMVDPEAMGLFKKCLLPLEEEKVV